MGNRDDFSPPDLINLINRQRNTRGIEIGKIEIMKKFSFFDADKRFSDDILNGFEGKQFNGKDIVVEAASERPRSGPPRAFAKAAKRRKKQVKR